MSTARSDQAGTEKIAAIQLLRAAAALTVATGHIAFAFADHLPGGLGIGLDDGRSGQVAVMLFFVVSGFVMVIAARHMFAQPGARRLFWMRRAIRIMPPYWIATALLALVFLTLFSLRIDPVALVQSLILLPYWSEAGGLRPLPVLWVGWTLFYEMLFYAVFGLFIVWRREAAIAGVAAVMAAIAIGGLWIGPHSAVLYAATRPVTLVFAAGMLLALWRERGGAMPGWLRCTALAGLAPILWLVPTPVLPDAMGLDYLAWAGMPAVLIAVAFLAGPLALPATKFVNRAGDASYSLYLLHVPVAWLWLWLWGRMPGFDAGPWDYLVSALAATVLLGWLFHRHVERPMTLVLNRWLAAPHIAQDANRKTA